jgi:hypothetical protein
MYVLFTGIIGCLELATSRRLVSVGLMCYRLQGDSFQRQPDVRNVNDVQQDRTTYSTGGYARGIPIDSEIELFRKDYSRHARRTCNDDIFYICI